MDNRKDKLAKKIANILEESCPAFLRKPQDGPAVWHQCSCLAMADPDASCTCVWHKTSSCEFGEWPKVKEVLQQVDRKRERKADKYKQRVAERQREIKRGKEE